MTKMTKAKKAKKAAAKSKAAEKPKDFETHLGELYEFFGPKFEGIDPPSVILSGMSRQNPAELSFDQLYALNSACMYEINQLAKSDQVGKSILVREKVDHFMTWLRPQSPEFQLLCLRTMIVIYQSKEVVKALEDPKHRDLLEVCADVLHR